MKKICKFIAPNGEYVEWGEFDDKSRVLTFEVKTFYEDGVLMKTEQVDFILPEELDLKSAWQTRSSYRAAGFTRTDPPVQDNEEGNKADEDTRKILND